MLETKTSSRPWLRWIDTNTGSRIVTMPHPDGGARLRNCLEELKGEGVQGILSLLDPKEAERIGLEEEPALCIELGMEFFSLPIEDFGVPTDFYEAVDFLHPLAKRVADGFVLAIHCYAGLGRSTTIAASLLAFQDIDPDDTFGHLGDVIGRAVPETPEQANWARSVHSFLKQGSEG